MKLNITRKLVLHFAFVLLVFSLVVGSLFYWMYSRYSMEVHREDLKARAVNIAETLGSMLPADVSSGQNSTEPGPGMGGNHGAGQRGGQNAFGSYGAYLKFIDDIAMGDVWLVDQAAQFISVGSGRQQINYTDLPNEALNLIEGVFTGEVAFSESFSPLLDNASITVGAPVYDQNRKVIAAVMLHSKIETMKAAAYSGIRILFLSIALGLIGAILVALLLSRQFVEPLKQMERTTQRLAAGDLNASTGVDQQDEIGSLANNIDHLAQQLKKADQESRLIEQSRRDFIAEISHELRTPVTVMRASAEALTEGIVHSPDQAHEYHQQLLAEAIQLERIVNDLLELTRLQNPDFTIDKTKINLIEVLSDAARASRRLALSQNVTVHCSHDVQIWPFEGDYGRLRQMFLIVLDNAIKFSEPGQEVWLKSADHGGNGLAVTIIDHGVGIAPDQLPSIFDRFSKLSSASNKKGSGLGLAIAKEIADRHGVRISVTSEPNVETAFEFTFPKMKIDSADLNSIDE